MWSPPTEKACNKTIDPKLAHSIDFRFAIVDFISNRVNRTVRTEPFETERGIEPGDGVVKPNRANRTVRTESGRSGS